MYTFKENDATRGTSFHDTTIQCSVEQMKAVLGEPDFYDNDGADKVNFEWMREVNINGRAIIFTVYDYKEYRELSLTEKVEWHVGGFNQRDTNAAAHAILENFKELGIQRIGR